MQYDKNHSGALEFEELHAVLADLGILVSPLPPVCFASVRSFCSSCFVRYAQDGPNHICCIRQAWLTTLLILILQCPFSCNSSHMTLCALRCHGADRAGQVVPTAHNSILLIPVKV